MRGLPCNSFSISTSFDDSSLISLWSSSSDKRGYILFSLIFDTVLRFKRLPMLLTISLLIVSRQLPQLKPEAEKLGHRLLKIAYCNQNWDFLVSAKSIAILPV